MTMVRLVQLGSLPSGTEQAIADVVGQVLDCGTTIHPERLDPAFALNEARGQYCSTKLLYRLEDFVSEEGERVLGITEADLFIPILTFVFGEALLERPAAVISLHRLNPRFYGLPEDEALMLQRAEVESIHELGHTYGLIHCKNYACVMHATHAPEGIDLKGPEFCHTCADRLEKKRADRAAAEGCQDSQRGLLKTSC